MCIQAFIDKNEERLALWIKTYLHSLYNQYNHARVNTVSMKAEYLQIQFHAKMLSPRLDIQQHRTHNKRKNFTIKALKVDGPTFHVKLCKVLNLAPISQQKQNMLATLKT